jgi:uncharacterized protein YndB with AHSA1/START domain
MIAQRAQMPHSHFLGRLAITLTTAALLLPDWGAAQSTPGKVHPLTMTKDVANRSPDIHWPAGFDPVTAGIFAHNELLINASCEQVWRHIIEAPAWPTWYPNAQDVQLLETGATVLQQGAVFRWKTFGQPLESRVHEFVPSARIGWYGGAPGAAPTFYHTFYLTPHGDGCRAITEELGNGPAAAYMRKMDEGMLHRGHDLWLATLKWVSEK